ncbi:hypothetical protein M3Y99_00783200 [Aphelenchoides fujianensis]|nr:hypothetical protein M3Y99_00783200 [Aphelenchoides fujianensis]
MTTIQIITPRRSIGWSPTSRPTTAYSRPIRSATGRTTSGRRPRRPPQKEAARKEKEEAKLAKQKVKEEAAVLKRSQRLAKKEVADSTEAHTEDDDEANNTEESGRHELSSLSALLPSEFELWRRKKSTVPVISERSLENISTRIRRHYNAQQTLTVHSTHRRNVKKLNRTSAAPPRRTEAMDVDEEEAVVKEPVGKGRKRKYDEIDLQSRKKNLYLRSRFITREYDMLVMIRALSFFLNPVHRFWLNPTVMRDLMHEYNPESRCKTVNSLMAASAREMVRPGRIAQMQYVVKTLTTFSSMNEVRNKLVLNKFESEDEQNEFFKRTFRQAYQLIFK